MWALENQNPVVRTIFSLAIIIWVGLMFYYTGVEYRRTHPVTPQSFGAFGSTELAGTIKSVVPNEKQNYFNLTQNPNIFYSVMMYKIDTPPARLQRICATGRFNSKT